MKIVLKSMITDQVGAENHSEEKMTDQKIIDFIEKEDVDINMVYQNGAYLYQFSWAPEIADIEVIGKGFRDTAIMAIEKHNSYINKS